MQKNTPKKILVLTTIYPAPDLKYRTSVVHYFTKEWIKMGYDVNVIYFHAVYHKIFYLMARLFREQIASITGAVVDTSDNFGFTQYDIDGVHVYRLPIFKLIPRGRYSKKVLTEKLRKIVEINEETGFKPDILIGHFSNPQLNIIYNLKEFYPFAKTCIVMHDNGESIKKIYKAEYTEYLKCIDFWGYRSIPIKASFENNFGKQKNSFMCYSGIPESYLTKECTKKFSEKITEFVYVGELIKRKYPTTIIKALNRLYTEETNYKISYVGSGGEEKNLKKLTVKYGIQKNVLFLGYLERNEVINILDRAECFIMISKDEAFGLVYLEAMARGCITIGSKNEGIDGVIQHGINGFLCEHGNEEELMSVINQINSLTQIERKAISNNAIKTALEMTDYKVAKNYINAIDKI